MNGLKQEHVREAKQHLLIALEEFHPLPKTKDDLIESMREYFTDQRVDVFGLVISARGVVGFLDLIAETAVESGKYLPDESGGVKVRD